MIKVCQLYQHMDKGLYGVFVIKVDELNEIITGVSLNLESLQLLCGTLYHLNPELIWDSSYEYDLHTFKIIYKLYTSNEICKNKLKHDIG